VSAGINFACGIKPTGTLTCWGLTDEGDTKAPSGTFIQVSAGDLFACGIKATGTATCWGWTFAGYGATKPPSGTFTQVSAGFDFACGIKSTGTATCWGLTTHGNTKAPDLVTPLTTPVTVSTVKGSQTYGSSSPSFTGTYTAPMGATITGTITCTKVTSDTTTINSTLAAGNYTIKATTCSGLKATTGNYSFTYAAKTTGFTVKRTTPTTPTISNLPSSGTVGGGFTATVSTNGDGAKSVTSNSTSVCTASGLVVTYVGVGTCSLTAHVGAGTDYNAANGTAQTFKVNAAPPTPKTAGYDMVGSDGGVFVFPTGRSGGFFGSLPGLTPPVHVNNIVGMVPTTTDQGYFLVGSDGGVFAFGNAPFLGSLPGLHVTPTQPITGIVAANTDRGYFLVGRDGGVFAFGTVPFLGSLPGIGVHRDDIIGIAATPSGNGYWLVAADGTVYGFGAAQGLGTAKGTSSPVSAIAGTPTGGGYWITTQNGTVYPFGNAKKPSPGTLPAIGVSPAHPVIGIVHTADTGGYWLIGSDGGIFAFGDAGFVGSLPGLTVHVTDVVGAVPTTG
jgi:hypothetical protein